MTVNKIMTGNRIRKICPKCHFKHDHIIRFGKKYTTYKCVACDKAHFIKLFSEQIDVEALL